MMRDTKALNDYQSKQTVVFLIGDSTTLDQGFIASLPPFLTSIKFLMLLIHMDETYQKHHHPFEVQINCTIHSQTIHLPHNLRSPLVFCSGESLLMFHEFRFLSKLDFFHSCYVDVLDYENIPTINNQTIPKNWGSKKKTPTACSICFPRLVGSVVLAIFLGPFPPRHANGLNELPLRGVIIPGMNDFFKPNDSGTAGTPTILRSFYPPPPGPEPNLNLFLDAKICRFFRIFGTVAVVMSVLGFWSPNSRNKNVRTIARVWLQQLGC